MSSPAKNGIELFAAGRNLENTLSLLTELMCSLKTAASRLHGRSVTSGYAWSRSMLYLALDDCVLDLVHLDFAEAFDLEQIATSS
jgi:hypothetical protein